MHKHLLATAHAAHPATYVGIVLVVIVLTVAVRLLGKFLRALAGGR